MPSALDKAGGVELLLPDPRDVGFPRGERAIRSLDAQVARILRRHRLKVAPCTRWPSHVAADG